MILYRYFEGKATHEDEEKIKEWLDDSSENQKQFLKERKLYDVVLLTPNAKVAKKKFAGRKIVLEVMKVAAVVAIVLGGVYFFNQYKTTDVEKYQTVSVPVGQHIDVTLPDGTTVALNSRTKLQYPVEFDKKQRHVILDGEAYFKVTHNEKKPFIVQTNKYNVEVLGTEFNVEAYSDCDDFKTTLVSGKVKVASPTNKTENIILKPKQMAYLKNDKLRVASVSDFNELRWRDGLIAFKNASFTEIIETFEKYYNLTIYIENNEVKKRSYSGKFHQKDGIDYILRVLQKDINFDYEYNATSSTITIK